MDNSAQSATAVKDPVCGMTVDPASARPKLEQAGKTYYFCCGHCAEKFKAEPEKYLNQPAQLGSPGRVVLGTSPRTLHPVPEAAKATPSAGASLATSPAKGDYVCPMC